MYICVCIYICVYVCMYIYIYSSVYIYICFPCAYIHVDGCRPLYTCTYPCIPTHTSVCAHVCLCVCVSVSVSVHRSCVGRMASGQEVRQAYKGRLVQLETLRPSRCILNTKDPNRADLRNNARKPGAQGPTKSQACCTIQVTIRHLSGAKLRVLGLRFRD